MKATREEDRLAKRLAVVERENLLLRTDPMPDAGLSGCGDHSCLVNPAKGVGTNGGCRCDEQDLRRMVSWQKREIARLRAALDAEREACAVVADQDAALFPEEANASIRVAEAIRGRP